MEPYEGVSARCALCDGEIYRGEKYYHINGQAVCRDCLAEYAVQVFAPYLVKGGVRNGENHGVGNSYAPRGGAAEPYLRGDGGSHVRRRDRRAGDQGAGRSD